jgi:hypothetical protein
MYIRGYIKLKNKVLKILYWMEQIMLGVFIFIIIGLVLVFINIKAEKYDNIKKEEKEEYNRRYMEDNNIPENAILLCCTNIVVNQIILEENWSVFAWKDNNILNFYGTNDCNGVRKISIPIEYIQFYTRNGDCKVENIVEGGGVSVGKAIIGGIVGAIIGVVLMGTVGMFIGFGIGALLTGRNKVTTTNKEIDNRKTYLNYLENNENKRMVFTSRDFDELLKLIPEKEMSYIENNKIIESESQNDTYKDIEKLAELRDKGILTEDEFNNKKKLLLDKIQ